MTDCIDLSDRMPAVAAGRAEWSPAEAAHLAGCADCTAEWRLMAAARGLGATASRVDPAAMAARVTARLAAPAPTRVLRFRLPRGGWVVGLAAAAAVVLAVVVPRRPSVPGPPAAAVAGQALPELDDLSTAELEAILREVEGPPTADVVEPSGMGDLNAGELERVLRSWEG